MKLLEKPPVFNIFDNDDSLKERAKKITGRLKRRKDKALAGAAKKWGSSQWRLTRKDLKEAMRELSTPQFRALELACKQTGGRSRKQLSSLKPFVYRPTPGWTITHSFKPLRSMALVLPSVPRLQTSPLIEFAVSAALAGIKERIVCISPESKGDLLPLMMAAGFMTEVTGFYILPPEEAMAALSLNYTSVPVVDKILAFADNNTAAMKTCLGQMSPTELVLTGASELIVLAEGQARSDLIALELAAHRERHPFGTCGLITPDKELLSGIKKILKSRFSESLKKAKEPFGRHCIYLLNTANQEEAVGIANERAPEHIWLLTSRPEEWESRLEAYGVLHIGPHAAEVLSEGGFGPSLAGDHGTAWRGMHSMLDFLRSTVIEEVVPSAYKRLGKSTAILSNLEKRPLSAETALTRIELKPWHET